MYIGILYIRQCRYVGGSGILPKQSNIPRISLTIEVLYP